MDSWVRFSAQSQAKDRLFRASQYACTLLGYTLLKGGASKDLLIKVKQLESHLSLGRKLLRLGNSAECLEAAKRAMHLSDSVLRFCVTVGHLNRAMYFACDNVLWAGRTGVLASLDQDKWSQRSFRYYLFALILNLTRDAYEISLLMEREARSASSAWKPPARGLCGPAQENGEPPLSSTSEPSRLLAPLPAHLRRRLLLLATVLHANPPLTLDLLKNLFDIFIPLDRLGLYRTGPGFVGACGLVSSILSLLTMVYPWLKLKP